MKRFEVVQNDGEIGHTLAMMTPKNPSNQKKPHGKLYAGLELITKMSHNKKRHYKKLSVWKTMSFFENFFLFIFSNKVRLIDWLIA